jgi:hypothetical protein
MEEKNYGNSSLKQIIDTEADGQFISGGNLSELNSCHSLSGLESVQWAIAQ